MRQRSVASAGSRAAGEGDDGCGEEPRGHVAGCGRRWGRERSEGSRCEQWAGRQEPGDGEGEAEGGKVTSVVVGLAVWIDGRA